LPNYYHTLGITKNASHAEIKKAYRALAKQYHPDKNDKGRDGIIRFMQIKEAYEVLSQPNKKAQYDIKLSHQSPMPYAFGKEVKFNTNPVYDFTSEKSFDYHQILKPIILIIAALLIVLFLF